VVLGVELLLQLGEALDAGAQQILRLVLVLVAEAGGVAGVEAFEAKALPLVDAISRGEALRLLADVRRCERHPASLPAARIPLPEAGAGSILSLNSPRPDGGLPMSD